MVVIVTNAYNLADGTIGLAGTVNESLQLFFRHLVLFAGGPYSALLSPSALVGL